jgi:hypothetical protein
MERGKSLGEFKGLYRRKYMNRPLFFLGKTLEGVIISAILIFCLAALLWSRIEHGPFWIPLVQWLRSLI